MTFLILFFKFFYIGLFAVGGGFAIIPFLQDLVDEAHWISQNDLSNIIALAEMTPGAVGVNMATYTGFALIGVLGGIVATLGLITPSIITVGLISRFWQKTKTLPPVISVFNAVKAAVIGLLGSVFMTLFLLIFQDENTFVLDIRKIGLFIATFCTAFYFKINPILYIILLGVIGAVIGL